jgi:hypothetical protein
VEKEETIKVKSHDGRNTELHTALRLLVGKRMVYYAVVLFDDFGHKFGVILQTAKTHLPKPGKKWLLKIGYFRTHNFLREIPSTEANWCVA